MGEILSNTWLITIVGSAFATLIAAYILYLLNNKSTILKIYNRALHELCEDARLSQSEERIFKNVLKDPHVVRVIKTRATDPGEEAQQLCKAIAYHAHPSSRLADPTFAATLVGQLLDIEFKMEGAEKYRMYHDRNRDREPYFETPTVSTGLAVTVASEQVILTWDAVRSSKGGSHIWRYHIGRSTNANGPFDEVGIVLADSRDHYSFRDDKGLTNGTLYSYTVTVESKVLKRRLIADPISALPNIPLSSAVQAPSPLESQASTMPVLPSTFFTLQESLRGKAANCIGREQALAKLRTYFTNANSRLILIKGFQWTG